jgi:hypothetical protein
MPAETDVATVYILGRSGREGSLWFQDFDSLALFAMDKAPGSYWIRRATVPRTACGWPDPIDVADWGVLIIRENGDFALTKLPDEAERDRRRDLREAYKNSPLPGPGRDGH